MSWKVYKWNGRFIQGDLVSSHSSEASALKKAKKEVKHSKIVKEESKEEIIIWLDAEDGTPMGAVIKKKKGTKRIRQGKKEEKCK